MRLNFTNFHEISSEIVSFQIRSAPQFHQFSSKIAHFQIRNFVRNGQISNKERGVPCRSVGRSPIRFFDLILNNALALRASHEIRTNARKLAHMISDNGLRADRRRIQPGRLPSFEYLAQQRAVAAKRLWYVLQNARTHVYPASCTGL